MFGLITRSVVPLAAAALSSSIVTGPEAATPNPGGVTDVESAADSTASSGPVAGAQTCSATVDPAEGSTTLTTLEGDEAEILTDAALADLSGGEVQLHDAESALETVDAAVNTVDAEGETFRSVTIPVGGDYIEPSNVTVIYDEAGDVASHSESLIRKQPSGDVHVTSYTDGQLSVDKTIDSETLAAADHPARQRAMPRLIHPASSLPSRTVPSRRASHPLTSASTGADRRSPRQESAVLSPASPQCSASAVEPPISSPRCVLGRA